MAVGLVNLKVENSDYGAFVRRAIKGFGKRIGVHGDVDGLPELARLHSEIDAALRTAVKQLRAEPWNYSWTEVGLRLGITRQSACERFGGAE